VALQFFQQTRDKSSDEIQEPQTFVVSIDVTYNTQDAKKGIATQNRKKPVDNEECKKAIDTKASTQSIHNAVGIETIDRLRRLVIAKPSPRISFYRLSPAVFAVLASVNTGSGGFDVGHGEMICVFVVFCF